MPDTPIAISDVGTYLYAEGATAGKYEKLVDITSAPATGSAPGKIDATTLSDTQKKYISDRPDTPDYKFGYNYTKDNFAKVVAAISLTVAKNYLIVYQDESGEKFSGTGATWKGEVSEGKKDEAKISFAVASHEHVDDTSTLISAS